MMERTFESIHRELLVAHYQSVKDLKTKTDSWKDRFEKIRYQKVRYQEEYAALKTENSRLRTEILSLQELKSKTSNSGFVQPCRVCESLQKTLDQLREAYKQSTQEKDRLLAILDAKLAECTNGESFLAQFKQGCSTPIQSLLVHNNGDNNRSVSRDCKQSPDSTISIAPVHERQPSGNDDYTQQNDTENLSKDMKLSLPKRRNQKRHIFTEKTSPQQKRTKLSTDTSIADDSDNKEQACRKRNRNKKAQPQVLVPETCDFDMDQSNSKEKSQDQSDLSVIKELSVKEKSSNEKIKSKDVRKKDEIDEGCIQNFKDKTSNCQVTGRNKTLIYTSDVKVIPETVQMDLFEGVTSSEDEQEDSDSSCQSTVKRAELTQSKYSLRSVLCSPPSSEDEDDTLIDMENAVNHRDIHLSGQSTEQADPSATNDGKGPVKVIDLYDSHDQIGEKNPVSSANQETVVMQSPTSSPFKSFGDESNHRSLNVKPLTRKSLRQDEIQTSDEAEQISPRKSHRKMSLFTSPEQHGSKAISSLSPAFLSPVFNTENKSKRSQDIAMSPGLFENEESDVIGQQEEPESPLLLRVTRATNEAEKISSNIKKQKSPMKGECIDIESDVDSPVLTLRSKFKRSKTLGSGSLNSPGKSDITISKLPSVKSLRLSKNSTVELQDPNVSSRQLRQTTLSQVFNNSPVKNKTSAHKQAQEEKDLLKAIQLSLEEATSRDLPDLDETVLEKENTPPFKKPSVPVSKSKIYSATKSPLKKGKRSKESVGCHGNQKVGDVNSLDETLPPEKFISNHRSKGVQQENTKERKKSKGTPDLSLNKTASQRNGRKSPTVQLSQLCEDSEFILDPADIVSSPKEFTDSPLKLQKCCSRSGFRKVNYENRGVNAKTDLLLNDDIEMSDSIVNDFRIDDLHDGNPDSEHKPLMTSTHVDDLDSQSIPCSSKSVKFGAGRRKNRVIAVADNFSEVVEEDDSEVEEDSCMDDSFDKLPKKQGAGFAHVNVVRKQNERRQLQGYNCKECFDYYKGMDLPEAEKKLRMQECSRHRAKYVPPSTPPHFWSIGFPDTQECEERGYINKEEDLPVQEKRPTFRRRKKLNKMFKSKNEEEEL